MNAETLVVEAANQSMTHAKPVADTAGPVLELPSFLNFTGWDLHHHYMGMTLHDWLPVSMSLLVGTVLVVFSLWSTRKMEKIPGGAQAFAEIIVEGLHDFLSDSLGKHTAKHLPFLGTIFLYIILMNLWGLIPFMHSPTNTINTTLALAIAVFCKYNYAGIKMKGPKYFKHYAEPFMLAPLMIPIHVIGEFARPISLSVRLFGNLTGEDITLALFVSLTPFIFGWIPIPIHFAMVVMALLFSTIQATVFTLLSSVYLSLALEEEH